MTSLTLTCIGRQQNTHDVVSWQLVPFSGSLPPVLAGQCITLHTEIDGQPHCRAYTLSSIPQDACWQVTIKDVGRVSRHLHQTLQVGDKIRVDGPFGDFNLTNLPCKRPLLLSAGSGITPMWAMLRDELAKRLQHQVPIRPPGSRPSQPRPWWSLSGQTAPPAL